MTTTTPDNSTRARANGRFDTTWPELRLFEVLAAVTRYVDPVQPERVSMSAFDAVRGQALGLADHDLPPTARAIVLRLNSRGPRDLGWRQWLAIALLDEDERDSRLRPVRRSVALHQQPTDRLLWYACQRVAHHLRVDTLSRGEYDDGRDELLAIARRAGEDTEALARLLPTANQLAHGREWCDVLRTGGLRPQKPKRASYAPPGFGPGPRGLSQPEAQVWFVRANGRYATSGELVRFMRDCRAALATWPKRKSYAACYDDAERLLVAEGADAPAKRPRIGPGGRTRQTGYELPPGGVIPGAPPSRRRRGREPAQNADAREQQRLANLRVRCIAGLAAFDAALPDGERRTRARYLRWRRGTRHPAPSTFDQLGGFAVLLRAARQG